mmetsp:Transcript_14230/g.56727  ORF Transcript_14230/g.56727 Transcript_14230/m.56727 type:complete len:92 (-) Transcript_14230:86-361(-)
MPCDAPVMTATLPWTADIAAVLSSTLVLSVFSVGAGGPLLRDDTRAQSHARNGTSDDRTLSIDARGRRRHRRRPRRRRKAEDEGKDDDDDE